MEQSLRIVDIMSLSLTKDKLTLEEQIEGTINGTLTIGEKEVEIKRILKEIVLIDNMITKWATYTASTKKE